MQKIDNFADLSPQITRQMRRGICTNAFFTPEEYSRAIAEGTLYGEEFDGGLLLLWARDGYDRLSFWLSGTALPFVPRRDTVAEIAFRDRDIALQEVGKGLEQIGFSPLFDRVRLSKKAQESQEYPAEYAAENDLPQVEALLKAGFHPLGGCLPTQSELLLDLKEGRILCRRSAQRDITAILHYAVSKGASKILHLVVVPEARKRGEATALLCALQSITDGRRSTVWTQADNAAAIACYEKFGYTLDGWKARVWQYRTEEQLW